MLSPHPFQSLWLQFQTIRHLHTAGSRPGLQLESSAVWNTQLRTCGSYFKHSATTLHLWERWEGDTCCLEQKGWGTVSHSKPVHAAKEFENLLTPSIYYPLQSLIHSHWENSSDIKHSYILGRHTQNNSLPCPEIALFLSCNLTSLYFWSQTCPQSDCIFRAGEMLVWIIDSYLYEALRIGRAARNFTSWALSTALPLPAKCSSGFIIHVHSLMSHYGPGII